MGPPKTDASAAPSASGTPETAIPARTRRRLSRGAARALLAIGGLVLIGGSIYGFVATSDAFDERFSVVAAARNLPAGHILSPADLAPSLVVVDDVPHIPWSEEAPFGLAGLAISHRLAAGSLLNAQMLTEPAVGAFGNNLEVIVSFDSSLAPSGVRHGDTVLLIDPGVEPAQERFGRPRTVLRALQLNLSDASSMQLFVPPAEWVWWRALPRRLGATPMVLPVPIGGDAESLGNELNVLWQEAYDEALAAIHGSG